MKMAEGGSYQQLNPSSEGEGEGDEDNDTPREADVIIHVVPESGKSRWNHIEDLDSFFTRMYHYHQKHGFTCMMLQEILELLQFVFVVIFTIFMIHCIDYDVLFRTKNNEKTSISDAILPLKQCLMNMGIVTWTSIFIATIFWLFRVVKVCCHFIQFWDIKSFFNTALKIDDDELDNLTWHEVQKKVIEVQKEQEMCIHKRDLTELDIYHRILRFKNYIVAMINKSLLPIRLEVPFLGNLIFFTQGLKYNLELLLFWGPWSPFENNWHLREDYKKLNKRQELAKSLSEYILWVGVVNILLSPLIFLWQILYVFFNYGELVKREPGALGTRTWSLYGKLYLRHFNELDHELNGRLNRAYRPASKYMSMFTSPLITVIAKSIAFVAGGIFGVLCILSIYDEDFLTVEHVLMIMTVAGALAALCRSLIPDEYLVWCPESLLTAVLAHTHYRPDNWRNQAHTQTTRAQVAQLFQYRAVHLLEELLSPLVTPYILCFHLRHKALDIVDFYRNFTIEVTGVGDICSFAQMDVKKHGNPTWQTCNYSVNDELDTFGSEDHPSEQHEKEISSFNQYTQAEDGKTELSLIHFTLTNPEWKPPNNAENFVIALKERAKREVIATQFSDANPFYTSLNCLSSLGPEYNGIVTNILRSTIFNSTSLSNDRNQTINDKSASPSHYEQHIQTPNRSTHMGKREFSNRPIHRGVNRAEGPLNIGERGLLSSLQHINAISNQSSGASIFSSGFQDVNKKPTGVLELTAVDMSLSTLYLHELHHTQIRPMRPRCSQVFIIHFRKMTSGFPAVFCFTSAKTTAMYTAIWQKLLVLIPELRANITGIMSDFEKAQIKSAKENFPQARISGCLFHYKQVKRRQSESTLRNMSQRSPLQELQVLPEFGQERAPLLLHQDSSIKLNKKN